jgi:hypothetical protein
MSKGWEKIELEYMPPAVMMPILKIKNPVCLRDRLCWVQQGVDGKIYMFSNDMLKPDYNEWNW